MGINFVRDIMDIANDDPYRVPKDVPGKNNLKDYMNDGWIVFTVFCMSVTFIIGLIVGVLADGFKL